MEAEVREKCIGLYSMLGAGQTWEYGTVLLFLFSENCLSWPVWSLETAFRDLVGPKMTRRFLVPKWRRGLRPWSWLWHYAFSFSWLFIIKLAQTILFVFFFQSSLKTTFKTLVVSRLPHLESPEEPSALQVMAVTKERNKRGVFCWVAFLFDFVFYQRTTIFLRPKIN